MAATPPPPPPLIEIARLLSGRQNATIRFLTPAQQKQMNVPNALVDPRLKNGKIVGSSHVMYMPQGTYQALESLTKDTGVNWPEKTQALALMTLIHESGHMRSGKHWQNERRQQRFALGKYMGIAGRLGIDPEKAKRMYDEVVRYTNNDLPKDYRPRMP